MDSNGRGAARDSKKFSKVVLKSKVKIEYWFWGGSSYFSDKMFHQSGKVELLKI